MTFFDAMSARRAQVRLRLRLPVSVAPVARAKPPSEITHPNCPRTREGAERVRTGSVWSTAVRASRSDSENDRSSLAVSSRGQRGTPRQYLRAPLPAVVVSPNITEDVPAPPSPHAGLVTRCRGLAGEGCCLSLAGQRSEGVHAARLRFRQTNHQRMLGVS